MDKAYLAALAAFLGGALISLINAVILAKQAVKNSEGMANGTILRQFLSFAYLAGTYLVIRKLGIPYMLPLLGAAIGLTVPAVLFALTIANKMKGDD